MPDTVLPEGTVVPSFSVWAGNPGQLQKLATCMRVELIDAGKLVDTLPETYQETTEARCRNYYQRFKSS